MQKLKESWKLLLIYSSFLAILAIAILGGMILSPSEPENSLFLRLSLPRLIFAVSLFIAFFFSASVAIKARTDHTWAERTSRQWFGKSRLGQAITWLAGIGLGLGWIGCFLPFYRAGILAVHWDRIRPVMVFTLIASAATLAMIFLRRSNFAVPDLKSSRVYKSSLLWFLPCILLFSIMLYTDFGVYAP